jgi:hypothetical protein
MESYLRHSSIHLLKILLGHGHTYYHAAVGGDSIEVRPCSTSQLRVDRLVGLVEEVQTEVEETTGDGLAGSGKLLLLEMPAPDACNECGECSIGLQLASGTVRCEKLF